MFFRGVAQILFFTLHYSIVGLALDAFKHGEPVYQISAYNHGWDEGKETMSATIPKENEATLRHSMV